MHAIVVSIFAVTVRAQCGHCCTAVCGSAAGQSTVSDASVNELPCVLEDLRPHLTECKHEYGASMGHIERLHAPRHGYAERLTPGTGFPGEPLTLIAQHKAHSGCPCR